MLDRHYRELEQLLAMDAPALEATRLSRFREVSGPGGFLVLFGAGELGRKTLAGLRSLGIVPLAIADNKTSLQGTLLEGVPVLSPEVAVERWGSTAVFVVATYNTAAPTNQLRAAGAAHVIPYAVLFAAHPEAFLPFLCLGPSSAVLAQADDIRRAFSLFHDEASKSEFVRQLERRLFLGFESPRESLSQEARSSEYFPEAVYTPLADEVFIDCGAYDGDTIRRFLVRRRNVFQEIVAIEPDPMTAERLAQYVGCLPPGIRSKIRVVVRAVSDTAGPLAFQSTGTVSASVSSGGTREVLADTLDVLLRGVRPTLIKMDLEASEPRAVAGARRVIQEHVPVLAVCVYHRASHLWQIPLQMAAMSPDYVFFLRAHAEDCWDVSVYAVPLTRLVAKFNAERSPDEFEPSR